MKSNVIDIDMLQAKYKLGEPVYLTTDPDQIERIVTGIIHRPHGIVYIVALVGAETYHYDIELSREPNILKKVN